MSGEKRPPAHRPSTLLLKGDVPEVLTDQQAAIKKKKHHRMTSHVTRVTADRCWPTQWLADAAAAKPNLEAKHSRDRK